VTVLQDGESIGSLSAGGDGVFATEIDDLERGTYTFALFAEDDDGVRSGTYSTTISLRADTENAIAGVVIPPTTMVSETEVDPGSPVAVSGFAPENARVEVFMEQQGRRVPGEARATTSAAEDGAWALSLPTTGLTTGTYDLIARARLPDEGIESAKSAPLSIGVGQAAQGEQCARADINRDSEVDLTDFSILLFNWNTDEPNADINLSGLVELADFSIMLFCWTG
jgi:hypothetical protein